KEKFIHSVVMKVCYSNSPFLCLLPYFKKKLNIYSQPNSHKKDNYYFIICNILKTSEVKEYGKQ
ncbi:hypothetical protein ABE42_04420, partial [Bacillus thuringiensis]|nr:hypothetical protein [Bacillus thuringiensis]